MPALPLRWSLGLGVDQIRLGVLPRPPLGPAQREESEDDGNEEPENVVDAGAVREHHVNHLTNAIATAGLRDGPDIDERALDSKP